MGGLGSWECEGWMERGVGVSRWFEVQRDR